MGQVLGRRRTVPIQPCLQPGGELGLPALGLRCSMGRTLLRSEACGPIARLPARPDQRRTPRHRVDHSGQHLTDQIGRRGRVEVVVRPGLAEHPHPVLVSLVEPGHLPLWRPLVMGSRLEAAGRDQPHAEERGTRQQGHARVQVVTDVGPGEHRQRGPHRQRHRAPVVAELDVRVTRRLGQLKPSRTGQGNEAQRLPPSNHADSHRTNPQIGPFHRGHSRP
ncbi:MAG: hypothetical protein QM714_12835 [Nocardioides sp.]|uniref:hypothetical protein n=1 Tax=Nocardioides sp. TaxID=35761 RepID=UPI0039E2AF39